MSRSRDGWTRSASVHPPGGSALWRRHVPLGRRWWAFQRGPAADGASGRGVPGAEGTGDWGGRSRDGNVRLRGTACGPRPGGPLRRLAIGGCAAGNVWQPAHLAGAVQLARRVGRAGAAGLVGLRCRRVTGPGERLAVRVGCGFRRPSAQQTAVLAPLWAQALAYAQLRPDQVDLYVQRSREANESRDGSVGVRG